MNDLDKIKQLFANQDINNHKLGYILAKNTLLISDEDIIKMIVGDWNGWYDDSIQNNSWISYTKIIFNTYLSFTLWETGFVQSDGLVDFYVIDSTIDFSEESFWKQITIEFKELINEIFSE